MFVGNACENWFASNGINNNEGMPFDVGFGGELEGLLVGGMTMCRR